jgi:HD-GYP domain-containing protein (c-di-GMP phosphodiesterase class II)
MTSDRPYRKRLPYARALEEIRAGAGSQFDPAIVSVFLATPEARWEFIRTHAAR